MNEVPTYTPPEGVHGPTLGRDLPDGCERLRASVYPNFRDEWWDGPGVTNDCLYWWRTVPLKVGDTVQLTGTVEWVDEGGGVWVQYTDGGSCVWVPTTALTRVVDQ